MPLVRPRGIASTPSSDIFKAAKWTQMEIDRARMQDPTSLRLQY